MYARAGDGGWDGDGHGLSIWQLQDHWECARHRTGDRAEADVHSNTINICILSIVTI